MMAAGEKCINQDAITEQDRIEAFANILGPIATDEISRWLIDNGFFRQAASTKYHGAYQGGLFDHSLTVTMNLEKLTRRLDIKWERPQSPLIVGMFHDLCKIDQYKITPDGAFKFVANTPIKGHGSKSVALLSRMMLVTKEEAACIRYHMGAFSGNDEIERFTNAIHEYPNVLWTHTADMMAAHIDFV